MVRYNQPDSYTPCQNGTPKNRQTHGEGGQGGMETNQRRYQSGGSVVSSQTIHECRPRQLMCALLGWGHTESKCSGKLACGYCSGLHCTSTHKCNVVGSSAQQGSRCGHTQEKCPNCKGNHIALSSRCAKKAEGTKEARKRRRREPAGRTT